MKESLCKIYQPTKRLDSFMVYNRESLEAGFGCMSFIAQLCCTAMGTSVGYDTKRIHRYTEFEKTTNTDSLWIWKIN